jgi:hypothetical protein
MDRVPRPAANRPAAVISLLAWLALATQAWGQDQRPRFQAGVDITSVDVSVVDGNGRPVQGLTPADFNVRIGGAARRVVTADWVPLTATAGRAGSVAAIPDSFTSNLNATPGRIILIAIGQQNIRFGGAIPIRDALAAFVDRLQPSDRVGLMILGRGGQSVPFTADRQAVKAALARVAGQKIVVAAFRHQIAMWEALAIHQDDNEVYRAAVMRECGADPAASTGGRSCNAAEICPSEGSAQARSMAVSAIDDGERMLERAARIFRGDAPGGSAQVAGGDERSGMEQSVNALVANSQLGAARELLEQWAATWPDDVRVAKPLALLYATFGRATDAVRQLQRHIAAHPDDVDTLGLAVEWLYVLRAGGSAASSREDDLDLARTYATQYRDRNGPESPLVQLWLDFMSSSP